MLWSYAATSPSPESAAGAAAANTARGMRTKHEMRSILVPESNSLNVDSPGNAFNIRRDCSRSERATRVGGDTDEPVLARMPGVPPAGSTGSAEDSVDSISTVFPSSKLLRSVRRRSALVVTRTRTLIPGISLRKSRMSASYRSSSDWANRWAAEPLRLGVSTGTSMPLAASVTRTVSSTRPGTAPATRPAALVANSTETSPDRERNWTEAVGTTALRPSPRRLGWAITTSAADTSSNFDKMLESRF